MAKNSTMKWYRGALVTVDGKRFPFRTRVASKDTAKRQFNRWVDHMVARAGHGFAVDFIKLSTWRGESVFSLDGD